MSNGPGDPAATGKYAIQIIQNLIKKKMPLFGICLGHQILALALGGKTKKMKLGHRGANHPVKNLINDNVEITSQNHGFEVVTVSARSRFFKPLHLIVEFVNLLTLNFPFFE